MYKRDLVLHNLQSLLCHKTKLNQTKPICIYKKYLALYQSTKFDMT